jgi:hypothetical protein
MKTIYSISSDGQERYDTVRPEMVAKTIKILQRRGQLNIKVVPVDNSHPKT